MIGDENNDDSRFLERLFTKVNATSHPGKPTNGLLCRTATEESKLKTWVSLTVLCSCSQVDKRYGQIVSSPYSSENNNVTVSDLYIPTIDLPILLQEICGPILEIFKSLTDI
jgi:hypothetical protein